MCLITNFTETKTLTPSEKMKQFLVFVVLILVFGFSAAGEPDKPKNPPTPIELRGCLIMNVNIREPI